METKTQMSMAEQTQVQSDAVAMGMAPTDVADIISKYGPDVMSTMVEGLKSGFSVPFILELFRLFGPLFLDFAISLFTEKKKMGMTESDEEVELEKLLKGSPVQGLPEELVKVLFTKLLPYVIKKYGPDMLAAVITAIDKYTKED
jgi:hypothetical protein